VNKLSNIIELTNNSNRDIHMSNGATSVFITVLGLSGTRLTKTDDEKKLLVWILEKDQSKCGIGTVGFSISEMPWIKENFECQQTFMLEVTMGVKEKLGWETLDYTPNEERIFPLIDTFYDMIKELTKDDIDEEEIEEWERSCEDNEPLNNGYPVCDEHYIFLTIFGCHVCNDR